jgi:hypothetical protein
MDGYVFDSLKVDVYQPGLTAADITAINTADSARGIAIATGYTCANEGCHMNGSFNGVSSNAYLGNYQLTKGTLTTDLYGFDQASGKVKNPASATGGLSGGVPVNNNNVYGSQDLRTAAIKGHALFDAITPASSSTDPLTGVVTDVPQVAWATSGTCRNCHDQVDDRFAGKAFPHSNTEWKVFESGVDSATATHDNGVNGIKGQLLSDYGYSARYNTAAWFTLADFQGGTSVDTNTRQTVGYTGTYAPRTVGMDGACLKCHKGSADTGVGKDF